MPLYDHEYPPLWVLLAEWDAGVYDEPQSERLYDCRPSVREELEKDYFQQQQCNDTTTPSSPSPSPVEERKDTGPTEPEPEPQVKRVDHYTTTFLPRARDLNYPFNFTFVFTGPSYRLRVWDRPYRPLGTATKPSKNREVHDTYTLPAIAGMKRKPVFFGR